MENTKINFLNSELSVEEKSKEKAKFHILPIPLEKTISCGRGTSKGPEAILKASNELERFTGKSEPCLSGIFTCLLYTSPSPRDYAASRMPSSA